MAENKFIWIAKEPKDNKSSGTSSFLILQYLKAVVIFQVFMKDAHSVGHCFAAFNINGSMLSNGSGVELQIPYSFPLRVHVCSCTCV